MQKTWKDSFAVYLKKESLTLLFLGFASGLPLWLYFGPLSYWLREAGVEKSTIGFFSFVGLCYTFKWLWSPLVDQLPLPILTKVLGRRRSWMLIAQFGVIGGLIGMALTDPIVNLSQMAIFCVVLAFFSATQDIVIDAFRIEIISSEAQAALAATYMTGYRLAQFVGGAGCFAIAEFFDPRPEAQTYDYIGWKIAYLCMAATMLIGVATTLLVKEPKTKISVKKVTYDEKTKETLENTDGIQKLGVWLYGSFVAPFVDFISRYKWHAVLILALISTYRISDIVLGVMAYPFYNDMMFTKGEVAAITKVYGVWMTLVGAFAGGAFMIRYGIMRILFLGAALSAITNILFSLLAGMGHDLTMLTLVISFDNFSAGLASAAFIAYLSSLTNVSYSATQYALFSSMMLLFPKFLGGFSGVIVEDIGYADFFIFTALIGVPVLILIALAVKFIPAEQKQASSS